MVWYRQMSPSVSVMVIGASDGTGRDWVALSAEMTDSEKKKNKI